MDPNTDAGQGAAEPQGDAVVQPTEPTQSQPTEAPDPSESSQGLIEPYLQDIDDPNVRETVADRLERFRSEQDAKVQEKLSKEAERRKAYEQYGDPEQVALATQIVNSFMADPVQTTEWLVEQARDELGVDVMSQLTAEAKKAEEQSGVDDDEPLTASKVLELLEQRDQSKQQEAKRQTIQQQQAEQARQRALGWFEDAVDRHDVPVDDLPDGVKNAMFARAQELRQTGLATTGQDAIDMAVAEFGEAFSRGNGGKPAEPNPEPTVANGGTAPPPENFDVNDKASRQERMLNTLMAKAGSGS